MRLLAIDSATESSSVALLADGRLTERHGEPGGQQSAALLPMVHALLAEAGLRLRDLDALVVGRGPGSFTGVRLAVGVAQGLALGAGLPIVPVSDLAMLAQPPVNTDVASLPVVACLDARMDEVYWCAFGRRADGLVAPLHDERLSAPDVVAPVNAGPFVGVGAGWARHPALRERWESRLAACDVERQPQARDALTLAVPLWSAGLALAPERVLPVYLRERVASPSRR
jgi:tRNA threonylcarbamoyladenosine biosynthesis protein TsaB